ncbi:peptidoglycan editing factor PgeF [Ferrovibrio sp.]|uniref:peptidoglycan editing factor PgeF n=1 Tax=Ferrovibrio sp. TaxID=1917215 RepID=UPI001B432C68|nr:peptidoglycan editing factor PgeF [Ferrovibrio sp.]MBP7064673.1 peptidoglycan editing factor PgeF [Ferrovibrio sp.]
MLLPESVTSPALAALPGLRHGFFTRRGGVSTGLYAALNCGPGSADDPAHVAENRRLVAASLGAKALTSLYQVHGREVIVVDDSYDPASRPKADGLVTRRRGIALGVLSADCTPVLFADAVAGVIGACHAGWRGALAGITDATLAAMEKLGADRARIRAAIGPTIRQPSYEVSEPFRVEFTAADAGNADFFGAGKRPGHWQFDLPGYLARRLGAAGVAFEDTGLDTLAEPERFFSYRRITLAGEPDYGRQVSAIALV